MSYLKSIIKAKRKDTDDEWVDYVYSGSKYTVEALVDKEYDIHAVRLDGKGIVVTLNSKTHYIIT